MTWFEFLNICVMITRKYHYLELIEGTGGPQEIKMGMSEPPWVKSEPMKRPLLNTPDVSQVCSSSCRIRWYDTALLISTLQGSAMNTRCRSRERHPKRSPVTPDTRLWAHLNHIINTPLRTTHIWQKRFFPICKPCSAPGLSNMWDLRSRDWGWKKRLNKRIWNLWVF